MIQMLLAAIIASTMVFQALRVQHIETVNRNKGAVIGAWISTVVRGYVKKALNEETGDGTYFGELSSTDGATWSIEGKDLVYYLMSDGSTGDENNAACTDDSGNTIGLGAYLYVPCDTSAVMPIGQTTNNSVVFTRTAVETVNPGYKTGFSQIQGVFYFGTDDDGEGIFTSEEDGTIDQVLLADKINDYLLSAGYHYDDLNSTRVLMRDPVITYTRTSEGGIKVNLDFTQANELAIRKDGVTPFTGDQSMGLHNLSDVGELYWGTVTVGTNVSTLTADGDITLYGEGSAINFDSSDTDDDRIVMTDEGLKAVTDKFTFTGDVEVGGDLSLEDSGAHLSNAVQTRGYVVQDGTVPFPTCRDTSSRTIQIGAPAILAQTTSDPEPLYGYYPEITSETSGWKVTYYAMVSGDVSRELSTETKIPYETWCNE